MYIILYKGVLVMELVLNNIESVSSKNITAEKKGIELKLIVNDAKNINAFLDNEDICDGDIWEWNLIHGIGNDVY